MGFARSIGIWGIALAEFSLGDQDLSFPSTHGKTRVEVGVGGHGMG